MERRLNAKKSSNAQQQILNAYQKQFSHDYIEKIAMKMVEFFKIFDEWHCGLNQLKKFNKVPIE